MRNSSNHIRRIVAAAALVALSAFAWGCGQTAPTGPDMNSIQQDQPVQMQGPEVPSWN